MGRLVLSATDDGKRNVSEEYLPSRMALEKIAGAFDEPSVRIAITIPGLPLQPESFAVGDHLERAA